MSDRHLPIPERVERFRRFYARENDRPLLGFFAGSEYPLHRYRAAGRLPDTRPLAPHDFDVERYLGDCDDLFAQHEDCGGDFIWSASAFWGIPWLEAAIGCPIRADHTTGSMHAEPRLSFADPQDIPVFDPESPWMRKAGTCVALPSSARQR